MRICVLTDRKKEDLAVAQYLKDFDYELVNMRRPVMATLMALKSRNEFGVYINVCEGYRLDNEDEGDYDAIEVIRALEELNLPFTGTQSILFDPTREEMQAAADAHGVSFAKGYRVKSPEEAKSLVANLRYPIMVKHPQSYASTAMTKESRCDSLEEVLAQVKRICDIYGAARMEEFIVGKEYTVLVVDNPDDFSQPIAYPPAELIFPPGEEFRHTGFESNTMVPLTFKQVTDLTPELQDIAVRMFKAIGMSSYGRCDVRVNEQGKMFILEINPNPTIMLKPDEHCPADYIILSDQGGYKTFFERLFRVAYIRNQQNNTR